MYSFDLDEKVAVVTGAGRGLGQAAALALAEAGAHVVLLARKEKELEHTAAGVRAHGRKALILPVDVADEKAVDSAAAKAVEAFGKIDILVNNAGMASVSPLLELSTGDLKRLLDVNVVGVFLCARAFGAHMVAQRSGTIINIASVAGLIGGANMSAYSASKGAVLAFTRALAIEWVRHQVTVNAIAPGYFRTPINDFALDDPAIGPKIVGEIPQRRVGQPEELGPLVVYLASDAARFMTGSVLVIDGGQTAK